MQEPHHAETQVNSTTKGRAARIIVVATAALSVILWCVAWFLTAYIQANDPKDTITGGGAFTTGLVTLPILLFADPVLFLAWLANVAYFIMIRMMLLGRADRLLAWRLSWLLILLPIGAYFPRSMMFSNENDIGLANIGAAVWLWHLALVVAAVPSLVLFARRPAQPSVGVVVVDKPGSGPDTGAH